MGRHKETSFIDPALCERAQQDLEGLPDGMLAFRLTAIRALSRSLNISVICEVLDTSRKTMFRWARDYKKWGLDGLIDRMKGHRGRLLNSDQEAEIKRWLTEQSDSTGLPVHWTLQRLQLAIKETMGISISISRLGFWLKEWGFRRKVPRPHHRKADPQAQEEFKKKSVG